MPEKRRHELIDLTGDDDQAVPSKRPSYPSGRPSKPAPTLAAGGSSAQPASNGNGSASQLSSGSQASVIEPDYVDLTQTEDEPALEQYGTLDVKVVGVRHYNGLASAGEVVLCRREPNNAYDKNAIRVANVLDQQIGHLPRTVVQKLSPFIDRGEIVVEAQLTGEKEYFDCPARLTLFGPADKTQRERIENDLKKDRLLKAGQLNKTRKLAEETRRPMGLTSARSSAGLPTTEETDAMASWSLQNLVENSEMVQFREAGDLVKTLAMDEDALAQMPRAEQPPQLKATLLPYQLQALAWMTLKENPKLPEKGSQEVTQLWKCNRYGRYQNVATQFVTQSNPTLFSGGILADDMGLGKTLEIISLIVTGGPGTTLIIAPVSVMSNWEQQIRRHVGDDHQPNVLTYYAGKKVSAKELMNYDVVITSYGLLTRDTNLSARGVEWRRVVLDEGHTIRNAKTRVASAACQLKAKSRWVLTGTPIINSVKDLYSMVKFLGITGGIEQSEIFNTVISRRLGQGYGEGGEALLQALMKDICLRRKKDMKFVDLKLPEKKEYVHRISFRSEEKQKYDALLSEARGALDRFQAKSGTNNPGQFQSVLERLLRLRQICNHWSLCKSRVEDLMKLLEKEEVVVLNAKNKALLQEALALFLENQEECAICYENSKEPVITNCKHVFCRGCIERAIEYQHKCPMCRNKLSKDCLVEPLVEAENDVSFDGDSQSSKTEAMLQIVKASIKNPTSKVIIFSQWTSFLNIVQTQLDSAGIKYSRIDGSMKAEKRDVAIDALDNDKDTRVMLASLAVCSVGLNLVSADTVILSDSWWAPAIEDQAIDRVHRLGQTRETTIWRLVMEDTVEERVLSIQGEKRELIGKAFQERGDKKKKAKETRMADVLKLLS